jgi:hypothetical protein
MIVKAVGHINPEINYYYYLLLLYLFFVRGNFRKVNLALISYLSVPQSNHIRILHRVTSTSSRKLISTERSFCSAKPNLTLPQYNPTDFLQDRAGRCLHRK